MTMIIMSDLWEWSYTGLDTMNPGSCKRKRGGRPVDHPPISCSATLGQRATFALLIFFVVVISIGLSRIVIFSIFL